MTKTTIKVFLLLLLFATSCRKEDEIVPSTSSQIFTPDPNIGDIKGFYLLNEGNMGNNKCTIDYCDYTTGIYTKNIYAERNPEVIKELGDVGNDIQIYRDRLYCVINNSNIVEVMNVRTAQHIDAVSIPNCRYITFDGDYAYVSTYAGSVTIDPNARLGYVAKVDLNTLEVVDKCTVGYQPEELVIAGDKLYVANSGGYRVPNYDNTISVIDLNTFTESNKIEVAINLHRLELDNYGYIWAASRGDYHNTSSKTYILDTRTDEIVKELDLINSNMCLAGDMLYILSNNLESRAKAEISSYTLVDTKTQEIVKRNFITDGSDKDIIVPYGIAVNPKTNEILMADATNYVNPGKLRCYSSDGVLKWSVTTGDIPAHITFTTVQLEKLNY